MLAQNAFLVANNGVDSLTCGSRERPCRSISQAIELAQSGDGVSVGPGIYGDIDGDGDVDGAGEEPLNNGVLVTLDKRVTVNSQWGASATTIRAPRSAGIAVVSITADFADFGTNGHGFTVIGFAPPEGVDSDGISVTSGGLSRVGGNVVMDNGRAGIHIALGSNNAEVQDNVSARNKMGFLIVTPFPVRPGRALLARNVASDNTAAGYQLFGFQNHELLNNVATRNQIGFDFQGGGYVVMAMSLRRTMKWGWRRAAGRAIPF